MSGFRDAGLQRPLNRRLGEVLGGVGVSTGGNTAGTTGTVFGPAVLVGVSGVTLSQSTRGNQATISIIASAESGVAIAAGTQTAGTGTVVFSNSNGLTFGLSGSSRLTGSFDGIRRLFGNTGNVTPNAIGAVSFDRVNGITFDGTGSVFSASYDGLRSIIVYSNSTASTAVGGAGSIQFSAANGVTFGLSTSGGTNFILTGSVGPSIGLAAGTQTATSGTVVFSNSNGVTFGLSNSSVLTASVAPAQISFWDASAAGELAAVSAEVTRLLFQRINIPNQLLATRAQLMQAISNSNNAGGTVAFSFGVYTMSGSTASLASSASRSFAYNSTLGGSSYTDLAGTRYRSMTLGTWSLTPGDYLFALQFRLTSALTSGSYNWIGGHNLSVDGFDYGAATSVGYFNHGKLSVSTAAFPATIGPGDIKGANFDNAQFFPYFQLVGTF